MIGLRVSREYSWQATSYLLTDRLLLFLVYFASCPKLRLGKYGMGCVVFVWSIAVMRLHTKYSVFQLLSWYVVSFWFAAEDKIRAYLGAATVSTTCFFFSLPVLCFVLSAYVAYGIGLATTPVFSCCSRVVDISIYCLILPLVTYTLFG